MARDKQLVVRLTERNRSAFQQFCHQNKVQASTLLDEIIQRLTSGDLALEVVRGKLDAASFDIEAIVREQVQEAIAKLQHNIDETVTEAVKEQVMAPIEHRAKPQKIESPRDNRKITTTPTNNKEIEASRHQLIYDPKVGFAAGEIRRYLEYKSRSFPSGIVTQGEEKFRELTKNKDPDGCPWYWKDTEDGRRYFRDNGTNIPSDKSE